METCSDSSVLFRPCHLFFFNALSCYLLFVCLFGPYNKSKAAAVQSADENGEKRAKKINQTFPAQQYFFLPIQLKKTEEKLYTCVYEAE